MNYAEYGQSYIIGSHMYGLTTPDSDVDSLTVYFDPEDYVKLYREHPEVLESHGNNTKLFSLDYFAKLLVKGNPNLVEVIKLPPVEMGAKGFIVGDFMRLMAENQQAVVHVGVPKAYMGHLNGIVKELDTKGVTPKRLSHALRVCYSVEHIVKHKELFILRENEAARLDCLYVKVEENNYCEAYVRMKIEHAEKAYHKHIASLPDNAEVKELVNDYFTKIYRR